MNSKIVNYLEKIKIDQSCKPNEVFIIDHYQGYDDGEISRYKRNAYYSESQANVYFPKWLLFGYNLKIMYTFDENGLKEIKREVFYKG